MTDNEIGVVGAKSLSEVLKVNTTLTSLNMRGQKEGKKGKEKTQEQKRMNNR